MRICSLNRSELSEQRSGIWGLGNRSVGVVNFGKIRGHMRIARSLRKFAYGGRDREIGLARLCSGRCTPFYYTTSLDFCQPFSGKNVAFYLVKFFTKKTANLQIKRNTGRGDRPRQVKRKKAPHREGQKEEVMGLTQGRSKPCVCPQFSRLRWLWQGQPQVE